MSSNVILIPCPFQWKDAIFLHQLFGLFLALTLTEQHRGVQASFPKVTASPGRLSSLLYTDQPEPRNLPSPCLVSVDLTMAKSLVMTFMKICPLLITETLLLYFTGFYQIYLFM